MDDISATGARPSKSEAELIKLLESVSGCMTYLCIIVPRSLVVPVRFACSDLQWLSQLFLALH